MMTPERRAEIEKYGNEEDRKGYPQVRESLAEIDRLKEQWQELLDAHRAILAEECSESDDRVHCTCVPFLRQEIDRLTADRDQLSNALDLAAAELDAQTKEIDRLNKVVDQLLDVIETHYDDNFDIDATDSSIVWGIEWEDSTDCVWTDAEKPELAAELERRSKV